MATETVPIDPKRAALACEAAWEIEALADQLIAFTTERLDSQDLAVRGMSIRIRDLAVVVMDGLTDEKQGGGASLKDMVTALRGSGKYVKNVEASHG